ncbi:MAG: 50S ribosomal protein L22 [Planctomycetes bacterium]|nr:50S ribosomal protein L22 [Planctomycetota bacterium]
MYKATHRFARITPRKARYVMDLVRNKPVDASLEILQFCHRRGAPMIAKVIRSALANAISEGGARPESLRVREAYVDEGPTAKRWRPRARGMAYPIMKRTSHLTIVLEAEAKEQREKKQKKGATAAKS